MESEQDPFAKNIAELSEADLKKAVDTFSEILDHSAAAFLNSCVHCGLCADACHYHLADGDHRSIPAHKLNLVMSVFKRYFTGVGRRLPGVVKARNLDRLMVEAWIDSLFGRCTLCGRCTINCSIGIDISGMIRKARSVLASIGMVPPGLQSTVTTAIETGNNMGIPKQDWVDTVEWLTEELQDEVDDPGAALPLDLKGANFLYALNPREPKFFPLSLVAVGKIFYAAGESWTFSSDYYDVTNYGLYSGEDQVAGAISDRLVQSMKRLGTNSLIPGECGHGYNSNRWEAPEWLSKTYGFPVKSIIQILGDYIREGRIQLDPEKNTKPVTLHDPCNLVRLGGVVEEQRFVLKKAVSSFIEMSPNREKNFCCGGGGGQLAMTRFASRRIEAGRIKAEQIKKTGAEVVVTPCHNCIDQLSELNREYDLKVEIKTVSEIVADALVIEEKKK